MMTLKHFILFFFILFYQARVLFTVVLFREKKVKVDVAEPVW